MTKIEIKLGHISLFGEQEAGLINITAVKANGDLAKAIAKLIGISTVADDASDRPTELVRATVDDMALLPGAPAGGPDLGIVNHLGQQAPSQPTMVTPGAIAPTVVHPSGEVQPSLAIQPEPIQAPATVVATTVQSPVPGAISGFVPQAIPKPVDTGIQPTVTSNPSASLTELRAEQQAVVSQFEVKPIVVALDPNVRFDISGLEADLQLSINTTFQKTSGFQVEHLRGMLTQATSQPASDFANLTPEQVLNMVWNLLVKGKLQK